jgi:hypothetical protein
MKIKWELTDWGYEVAKIAHHVSDTKWIFRHPDGTMFTTEDEIKDYCYLKVKEELEAFKKNATN